ncbi:hypothetical protein BV903_005910 [Lysobacter enzymogenes]|nr:hypothetical protein [Lysobacter enzymogenes]UZW61834.1 hypothetical protein BV903_005910 [Lysobacter enzymogenes]
MACAIGCCVSATVYSCSKLWYAWAGSGAVAPLPKDCLGLPFSPSLARGVLQTAFTTPGRPLRLSAAKSPRFSGSFAVAVGQTAFAATWRLVIAFRRPPGIRRFIARCAAGDLLSSFATTVGQTLPDDPDSVAPVRSVDGASWNNNRPAGVAFAFQVSENSVEPQRDEASNVFAHE